MIGNMQAATSLQLAAWAMAQLQSSVHTLYRCQLWISSLAKTTINTKTRTRTRTNTNTKKQRQPSMHPLLSGVCEEGKTSSADILASLARALEGYVPMLAMIRWSRFLCKVTMRFLSTHFSLSTCPLLSRKCPFMSQQMSTFVSAFIHFCHEGSHTPCLEFIMLSFLSNICQHFPQHQIAHRQLHQTNMYRDPFTYA